MSPKLTLHQGSKGYRFSRDSFLLADFFRFEGVKSILDLGAGAGAVSIPIGFYNSRIDITALEINFELAKQARINASESGLKNYRVVVGDILCATETFGGKVFDAIVCNPPYKKAGSGRLGHDIAKAMARHEVNIRLGDIIEVSSRLLRDGGSLSITMTYERREEYKMFLARNGFFEVRLREVKATAESEPYIFLSEAFYGAKRRLEAPPPLVLRSSGGGDSEEYNLISSRYG
ncbi:hypothetical protein MNBD_NITROSPINAE02-7 [hydrothermal vent metagenome]|uniref:Methyltransferase small domain-containing protein n=1 Tax=hydrothermal vent metagenome TaxID=652676 RepID=A0A3B1D243_9ZZZZ